MPIFTEREREPEWHLAIGMALAVVVAVYLTPWFLNNVVYWGRRIRETDIRQDYFEALIWAAMLAVSILFWPVRSEDKPALLTVWALKVLVALGAMLLYESHYGLDAYWYYRLTHHPLMTVWEDAGSNRIVMLARAHQWVSFDSYHAIKLDFAFVGLIGIYLYYRAACQYLEGEHRWIFWSLALVPSIIFWSSILGKDPVVFLGYAVYSYGVVAWCKTGRVLNIALVGGGMAIAGSIRIWTAGIMAVPFTFLILVQSHGPARVLLTSATLAFSGLFYGQILQWFKVASAASLLESLQQHEAGFATGGGSATGQLIQISGFADVLRQAPMAMFNALFRPLPGEVMNPFGLLAGLEDLVLLVLAVRAMARLTRKELADPIIGWAIFLVIVWAALYGMVAAGNLGALDRFRLQILPVIVLLFLYLGRASRASKV